MAITRMLGGLVVAGGAMLLMALLPSLVIAPRAGPSLRSPGERLVTSAGRWDWAPAEGVRTARTHV